jgi:hypothetical protein
MTMKVNVMQIMYNSMKATRGPLWTPGNQFNQGEHMKILNINNMAEFLPEYPNHKIVLFEDSPEIIAQPHTLQTSAKL